VAPDERGAGARRFLLGLTAAHAANDFYGFVVPPLLPALQAAFGLTYLHLGMLPFATTAVSAVAQPLVGYWADAHRRRRLALAAGFCLYPLGMVVLGTAPSYAVLFLGASLLGLAGSAYHPQSTTLLIERFAHRRGWASGIHGIGNSIGFALAPLVVAPLAARYGWRTAVVAMAVPALVAAAGVWRWVREPRSRTSGSLRAGFTRPLLLLTAVNGLQLAVAAGFVTFLPSYYTTRGVGLAAAGLLTASVVLPGIIAQPAGGTLSDRFGRRQVFTGGLLGLGLCVAAFPFAGETGLAVAVVMALVAQFWASVTPSVSLVYAAELAPGGRTGQAVGLAWGAGTAISSLAPPLTGAAIDRFGFTPAYVALGIVAIATALLAQRLPAAAACNASHG
jgi:FSR family fosmidomycin resistance protein-like MFS transporter